MSAVLFFAPVPAGKLPRAAGSLPIITPVLKKEQPGPISIPVITGSGGDEEEEF